MSEMLKDKQGVVCLMDDILVYGATQQERDKCLEAVLQTMLANGMTLNKAKFTQKKILFLGQEIDKHEIRPDPAKISTIRTMLRPLIYQSYAGFLV